MSRAGSLNRDSSIFRAKLLFLFRMRRAIAYSKHKKFHRDFWRERDIYFNFEKCNFYWWKLLQQI
jgi:hypothetical protein